MRNIYFRIADADPLTTGLVMATVTASRGSTPQKPGCTAIYETGRLMEGTVGGGVVENKVGAIADRSAITRESSLVDYYLDKDAEEPEEALCGGVITILIDGNPLKHLSMFRAMKQSITEGTGGVLVTQVNSGGRAPVQISRYWTTTAVDLPIPDDYREPVIKTAQSIIESADRRAYRGLEMKTPSQQQKVEFFLEPVFPLPELVIAGAGHVGKAVSHMGRLLGFEVTVIDDRKEFANSLNLPDADNIIVRDIGEAMAEVRKDRDTFIVIVTRGHSHDAEALRACIGSQAAYVGMMGSKVKVAAMHEKFLSNNWATKEEWGKIYTPIGFSIGSQTVEEIAVSIAAQLIQVRNKAVGSRQ
jgi:xanthine dehydrogenase accessory factor